MAYSGSLTPSFVNNDCVTAEITYSTAHALHEVLTLVTGGVWHSDMCAPPRKHLLLPHGCVRWVSHQRRKYRVSTAMAAASVS